MRRNRSESAPRLSWVCYCHDLGFFCCLTSCFIVKLCCVLRFSSSFQCFSVPSPSPVSDPCCLHCLPVGCFWILFLMFSLICLLGSVLVHLDSCFCVSSFSVRLTKLACFPESSLTPECLLHFGSFPSLERLKQFWFNPNEFKHPNDVNSDVQVTFLQGSKLKRLQFNFRQLPPCFQLY